MSRLEAKPAVRLTTLNVRNLPDLSREHVRHDMRAVKRLGGIHLWQEIAEADDRADLLTCYPAKRFRHVGTGTEVPMTFSRATFHVLEAGREPMADGVAGLTPDRFATYAIVRRKGLTFRHLPTFAVVNTHTVSGAWTPGHDRQPLRRELWNTHAERMGKLIDDLRAEGHTVLGGGDLNHPHAPAFVSGQLPLHHSGLDYLFAAEAPHGARVATARTRTIPNADLFTDHPALAVAVWLEAGK